MEQNPMKNYALCRKNMIDGQLRTNGIIDEELIEIFKTLPREVFLPPEKSGMAYVDEDVDLGNGLFLMEPLVFARMVAAAEVRPDDIVLNIGDHAGYSSAFLSKIVSTVVTLESKVGILDRARKVWTKENLCNIALVKGTPAEGSKEHSPYSLIFLNGAVREVPQALLDQLSEGGRLVTVLRPAENVPGQIVLYKSLGGGRYTHIRLENASTPFLDELDPAPAFVF